MRQPMYCVIWASSIISYRGKNGKAGELTEVHVKTCPLIVNATPLGTFPHVDTCPDIPYDSLDERNLLFDLVYNPPDTLFMKKGREHGAAACCGATMLELQAEKSWEIWQ